MLRSVWIAASVFLLAAFLVSLIVRWGVFTADGLVGAPDGPQQRNELHLLYGNGSLSCVTMRVGAQSSFAASPPDASRTLAWRVQGGRWLLPHFKSKRSHGTIAVAPLWIPLALVGGPCAFVLARERARRRGGRCVGCGYALGGLPGGLPGGVACPECGEEC